MASGLYILTEETRSVTHEGEVIGDRKVFNLIGDNIGCKYEEGFDAEDGTLIFAPRFKVVGLGSTTEGIVNSRAIRDVSGEHADPEASFREVANIVNDGGILANVSSFALTKPKTSSTKKADPPPKPEPKASE